MALVLMLIGLAVLAGSIWAWRRNKRLAVAEMPMLWQKLWRWRWVIGVCLAVSSYFMRYPLAGDTDQYIIHGIPFLAYAFDQRGFDYVGPLTMPAIALNFATWLLLPQLLFWVASRFAAKQPANNNGV